MPEWWRTISFLQQVRVEVGLADGVDDRGRVEAQVQEDAQVAELEVRIDQRGAAPQARGASAMAVLMAMVVVPTPPLAP